MPDYKVLISEENGQELEYQKELQLHASNVSATPFGSLISDNVEGQLQEAGSGGGSGVSQTCVYGSGGNTSQNSYLPNESVPSNVVGVPIGITNAKIKNFFLGNENVRTGNVLVQERFPAGIGAWTTIYTASLNNESFKSITGLDVAITANAELAIFTEVSLKNCKIVLNINGDSAS